MESNNPFNLDAATATEKELSKLQAHGGVDIQNFCGTSHHPDDWLERGICVLKARKGFGKSHLLAIRSINHRNSKNSFQTLFYPSGGYPRYLLDPLTELQGVVPRWLEGKEAVDPWVSVWQLAIIGLLVWISDVDTTNLNEYAEWFGRLDNMKIGYESDRPEVGLAQGKLTMFIGRIVEKLKNENYGEGMNRLKTTLFEANSEWATAITRKLVSLNRNRIALYLDAPDEMVDISRINLWRNVQQGLLIAIWKFSKTNPWSRLLNIYATVRSEAFGTEEDHPNIKQAESLLMVLQYTRQDLLNIVNERIALAEPSKLFKFVKGETSPLGALCGFEEVEHYDRINLDGSNFCESIFDAILRHTREIPRELIAMARKIYEIDIEKRSKDMVRVVVNATARQNISDSIKHSFLGWDDAKHRALALNINKQVMHEDDVLKLVEGFGVQGPGIIKLFIRHGLFGVSERQPQRHKNYFIQFFSYDQVHGDEKSSTITKDWYFVHPAFKEWIISLEEYMGRKFIRSTSGVVGNGMPYEARPPHIRLGFESGKGVIFFGKICETLIMSNIESDSYPMRFLFVSLLACRELKKNEITITIISSILEKISTSKHTMKSLQFPLGGSKNGDGAIEKARDYAKKINKNSSIRAFQKSSVPPDWLAPFVSIGAKSSIGAEITISFPSLDLSEVDYSNSFLSILEDVFKR